MIDDVLAYPHQIGDALWRIEAASVPASPSPGGLVVCGASGRAGDLAAAVLGGRATAPVRDGLPAADAFVLCASYSGDDRSALECFDEAGRLGCPRAVVCTAGALAARARSEGVPVIGVPGGMPDPDNAIVYFLLAALECAERAGAGPSLRAEAEAAYAPLVQAASDERRARLCAERLRGHVPVIHGDLPIALRWRDQMRLKADVLALTDADPLPSAGPLRHVSLDDLESSQGAGPLERVLSLVLLGDIVAHRLAG